MAATGLIEVEFFYLVAKSCPTLCDRMESSMPVFTLLHCLPACPWPLSQWCYLNSSSSDALFTFFPLSFPGSGYFPMSQLFASDGQSIGVPASASVLPKNIQGPQEQWSPDSPSANISFFPSSLSRTFILFFTVSQQDIASELSNWYSSYIPLFRDSALRAGKKLIWMNLRFFFWRNI